VTLLICTDHVQVKDALEMYEGIVEHPFKMIHCWYMLRNEMKWNTYLQSVSAASAVPQDNPPAPVLDDTLPARIERPMGRDKAKKQCSGTSSSSSSACLEVLQKLSMDQYAQAERAEEANKREAMDFASRSERKLRIQEQQFELSKRSIVLQEKMIQLQEKDRTDCVMTLDVEKMTPWVREYYINQQKQIAAQSMSTGPSAPSGSDPSNNM
jgi:hypothetical protein